jgi:hypothetical protein
MDAIHLPTLKPERIVQVDEFSLARRDSYPVVGLPQTVSIKPDPCKSLATNFS